jgi:hypothetical protein
MLRLLSRAHLIFIMVFLVCCAGVVAYQQMQVWPAQHCEKQGGWWDARDRQCGEPIPLWRITGRGGPPGSGTLPLVPMARAKP